MRKFDEFDDDYFEDDLDESVNSSRYRLKKRGRRKNMFLLTLIIVCVIGGFSVIYSLFHGTGTIEEADEKSDPQQFENTNDEDPLLEEDKDLLAPGIIENESEERSGNLNDSLDHENIQIPEEKENSPEDVTQADEKIIEHTVQRGDSLYQLSIHYYKSPQYQHFLAGFNNLKNSNELQVGQRLMIPFPPALEWHTEEVGDRVIASTDDSTNDSTDDAIINSIDEATNGFPVHIVQAGDTLYSISVKYYNSAKYQNIIAEHNELHNPEALTVGLQLEIPAVSTGD
ncbi:LysM peptidoglycan-binding domain-containing protein [Calidifontibacillus oryziterrae]|uniref:LysM peptidoglycan-binding domain-containing protein n=1 Tax=Calidifontibacillus oryziterrae TaxID=1191699 RepID=UPI0003076E73|nr:LysM peptidoglycan-binding domain-containing protein [Calidifontibacillus oryziterrae]